MEATMKRYTFEDDEIRRHIDTYARLTGEADALNRQIEDEKAYFSQLAERDILNSDSKAKTVRYYGDGARVTAQTSCTVKISRLEALGRLFGSAYNDYVKEEIKTDIKDAAAKRMLAAVFFGETIDQSTDEVINQMTPDDKQRSLLRKKLKGANNIKDAEIIQTVIGCNEKDGIFYASIFAEAKAYEEFLKMLRLSGLNSATAARELIHQALTVEKTAKVGIELTT